MWTDDASRPAPDRGAATVWMACAIAALVFVSTFLFWLGAAAVVRHRTESAADLGAAGDVRRGADAACARARWVADRMNVGLTSGRVEQWDAFVEVRTPLPRALRLDGCACEGGAGAPATVVDRR
jgi:secretion/DNA translocation related TadE-like protein